MERNRNFPELISSVFHEMKWTKTYTSPISCWATAQYVPSLAVYTLSYSKIEFSCG